MQFVRGCELIEKYFHHVLQHNRSECKMGSEVIIACDYSFYDGFKIN